METVSEIQDMRVSELKEFLKRNEVEFSSIPRRDGTSGPPRKSDLLERALLVRTDYENPQAAGPTSPKTPRNIFQSGYSPKSPGTLTPAEASPPRKTSPRRRASEAAAAAEPEKMNVRRRPARASAAAATTPAAATPGSTKARKPRRRSSTSWINPAFNPALTPRRDATPARRRVAVTEVVEEFPADAFDDHTEEVVQSDYSSGAGGGGGASGADSDGSVIDTDDDEGSAANRFRAMKVYEIREWLNDHDVPYNHRSKKAELISLATAHALYLENTRAAVEPEPKPAPPKPAPPKASAPDEEVVEVGPTTKSKPARRSAPRVSADVAAKAAKEGAYHRSRSRVIAAPLPDEDTVEKAVPAKSDDVVTVKKVRKVKRRHPKKEPPRQRPLFRLPALRMPALPKITITRRGVMLFIGALFSVLLAIALKNEYDKSTWPYCDTDSTKDYMPDGKECHRCPLHGVCEKGQLTCVKGYFASGKRCVEDEEVSRYSVHLTGKLQGLLKQYKGKYQCGKVKLPNLTEDQLREPFNPARAVSPNKRSPRRLRFSTEKYEDAFQRALLALQTDYDGEIIFNPSDNTYESVDGRRPLSCILWKFVRRHIMAVLLFLVTCFFVARWRIRVFFRRREEAIVEGWYEAAVDVLRELRVGFEDDEKGESFMIDTQLREDLLGRTTNEKVALWAKVTKLLKADSRVLCAGPRTIKGMPCYTYEWRGNLRRPSLSRSGSRDGFRDFSTSETESRRRLSFGSAARRHSGAYESPAGSPHARTSSGSPGASVPSPGYRNMLNFWNR